MAITFYDRMPAVSIEGLGVNIPPFAVLGFSAFNELSGLVQIKQWVTGSAVLINSHQEVVASSDNVGLAYWAGVPQAVLLNGTSPTAGDPIGQIRGQEPTFALSAGYAGFEYLSDLETPEGIDLVGDSLVLAIHTPSKLYGSFVPLGEIHLKGTIKSYSNGKFKDVQNPFADVDAANAALTVAIGIVDGRFQLVDAECPLAE